MSTFTLDLIKKYLPGLHLGINFSFTSEHTDLYNCTAWAIESIDEWVQFYDSNGFADIRIECYIEYYKKLGYEDAKDEHFEEGMNKIAIFMHGADFTHVARQLHNGKWTSKLGEWEDIEHDDLNALSGNFYGYPKIFLKRKIIS